ncbi:hypothetical protein SAY86_032045 [Trapa natans]|uniref:Uncharacterized protein n=1 Tax=Trapa natans TaxID=22666 RepID=A0AAN7M4E5_TRANT|nr:hypothetical protein SAY86_032045 [Trapa natans]
MSTSRDCFNICPECLGRGIDPYKPFIVVEVSTLKKTLFQFHVLQSVDIFGIPPFIYQQLLPFAMPVPYFIRFLLLKHTALGWVYLGPQKLAFWISIFKSCMMNVSHHHMYISKR